MYIRDKCSDYLFFITILDLPPNPEGLERGMELRNLNPEVAENMENDTAGNRQL